MTSDACARHGARIWVAEAICICERRRHRRRGPCHWRSPRRRRGPCHWLRPHVIRGLRGAISLDGVVVRRTRRTLRPRGTIPLDGVVIRRTRRTRRTLRPRGTIPLDGVVVTDGGCPIGRGRSGWRRSEWRRSSRRRVRSGLRRVEDRCRSAPRVCLRMALPADRGGHIQAQAGGLWTLANAEGGGTV